MKTVDEFFEFFSAIPNKKWCIETLSDNVGRHCALGHLDMREINDWGDTNDALVYFARKHNLRMPDINDGRDPRYQQATPKARILAALIDLKNTLRGQPTPDSPCTWRMK